MKYVDLLSPVICAIYQPALEIGHAAANLLIDYIEARKTGAKTNSVKDFYEDK